MGKQRFPREDLTGREFEQLTVRCEAPKKRGFGPLMLWICDCTCGGSTTAASYALQSGRRKSCGCLEHKLRHKRWTGHGDISGSFWRTIPNRAKRDGIELSVTIADAWQLFLRQEGKCALTGVPIMFAKNMRTDAISQTASLDRIDSAKGYEVGNVQWVHKTINFMKHWLTMNTFVTWCKLVSHHGGSGLQEKPPS